MLATHAGLAPIAPVAGRSPRPVTRLGIVGAGEVVRQKLWPAVRAFVPSLDRVVVCSLEPTSPLAGLAHDYFAIEPGNLLPLGRLHDRGVLEPGSAWVVATPTASHVQYALQFAPWCRVVVEKPLAASSRQARLLLPLAARGVDVHAMDHKLFAAPALAFVDECRLTPALLDPIHHIDATFLESAGFSHGRHVEDVIADVQWHLLVVILALFKTYGFTVEFSVEHAWVATHEPDPAGRYQTPGTWTASRLQGHLRLGDRLISFDLAQAKAAPVNDKTVRLLDAGGRSVHVVDLNESGWRAHARILREVLSPAPDFRHSLADAIGVMAAVDAARALAREEAPYSVGGLPDFLAEPAMAV